MNREGLVLLIGMALGCIAGFGTALFIVECSWREETVKRGIAEYNSTTGVWQWKEPIKATTAEELP